MCKLQVNDAARVYELLKNGDMTQEEFLLWLTDVIEEVIAEEE